MKTTQYQPKTGQACGCKRGVQRDNCPQCEGTGQRIDFSAIRARKFCADSNVPTAPACPEGEHTRSKWEFDAPNGAHGPCWVRAFGESPMHNLICECAGSSPTREANARLIARVPDLLADNERLRAALQQLFNCVPLSVEGPDPESKIVTSVAYWRAAYDQSRAALAEGGGK